jgi:hypothetical protein
MRVLGEIIIFLLVGLTVIYLVLKKVVMPELHRRRIERLERENEELDRQLQSFDPGRTRSE